MWTHRAPTHLFMTDYSVHILQFDISSHDQAMFDFYGDHLSYEFWSSGFLPTKKIVRFNHRSIDRILLRNNRICCLGRDGTVDVCGSLVEAYLANLKVYFAYLRWCPVPCMKLAHQNAELPPHFDNSTSAEIGEWQFVPGVYRCLLDQDTPASDVCDHRLCPVGGLTWRTVASVYLQLECQSPSSQINGATLARRTRDAQTTAKYPKRTWHVKDIRTTHNNIQHNDQI